MTGLVIYPSSWETGIRTHRKEDRNLVPRNLVPRNLVPKPETLESDAYCPIWQLAKPRFSKYCW